MAYTAVFAAIHVADLAAARTWYEQLAGRPPDLVPNDDEVAWQFTDGGWLCVVRDAARAGRSAVTLLVDDLDDRLSGLALRGVAAGEIETYENGVRHVVVTDPEGNTVAFAEVPAGS